MEKVKAICINNIIKDRIAPFTIGKIYEVSVITNQEWAWVFSDLNRMGHYPMSLFKTLEDHREEILNELLTSINSNYITIFNSKVYSI